LIPVVIILMPTQPGRRHADGDTITVLDARHQQHKVRLANALRVARVAPKSPMLLTRHR
jgi:hypothetical protein